MMKKAMFSKFTNFIQQTVDAFSPNIAPQEEFLYHWKSVTGYFLDNKDGGARIEETALPEHLSSMLRVLQEEEQTFTEAGTTGTCLEYLLQHRLLETLYTLGRTDHPPGMKQIVLSFFTKLLSRISHPLLPHINVHRAIQRMVKACGETRAAPTEKEEIEFLCTVCAKIKTDPYLVNFFIESPRKQTDTESKEASQRQTQAFSLVDALLTLSHSEDARVSVKACEGLMLCASLPEHSAANALIEHTQFCQTLASILNQSYEKLPAVVSPEDILSAEAKWGFDDVGQREDQNSFQGRARLISFLSWLDYCDQLIAVANPAVAEALSAEIHKQLLTGQFFTHLIQPSESGAIIATFYLNRCLRTVNSPVLLKEFCFFLLGKERSIQQRDGGEEHVLHKRLLDRCNHVSEEVCLATLRLFDTLLQKEEEHVYHCLLIRNLLGRSYLEASPSTESPSLIQKSNQGADGLSTPQVDHSASETTNKETVTEKDTNTSEKTAESQSVASSETDTPATEEAASKNDDGESESNNHSKENVKNAKEESDKGATVKDVPSVDTNEDINKKLSDCTNNVKTQNLDSPYGKSEVHKVVNCFLSVLPEEAKSSYQTADTGYDMYLRDAHKQYSIQETICKSWNWPKRPVALKNFSTQPFYEGSFLHMLMEKLWHLLDQSYSVNLVLTALIARVAMIPHPNLHEYLLEPYLPCSKGVRTLYHVLSKVANDIKHHQKTDAAFFQKLLLARKQLLGVVPSIHKWRMHDLKSGHHRDGSGFEDQSRMEAIIVLEEFCKELSAITFVKHHAAVTRF